MKNIHKISTIILLLVIGLFAGYFLFSYRGINDEKITGEVISDLTPEEISEIPKDDKEEINEPEIFFDIASIEVIRDFEMDYILETEFEQKGDFYNQLYLTGDLINNKDIKIKDLILQIRFYNEKTKGQKIEYLDNYVNEMETKVTNLYVNINKNLFYQSSSEKFFPANSKTSESLLFKDVPPWRGDSDYVLKGLLKGYNWRKGNYDINEAELILYHDAEKIQTTKIELPPTYTRNTRLNISRIDTSYKKNQAYLDAITFSIQNEGNKNILNPKIEISIKELIPKIHGIEQRDYKDLLLEVDSIININSEQKFRFSLNDLQQLLGGSENKEKGYKLYFSLYDNEELLDEEVYYFECGEKFFINKQNSILIYSIPIEEYGFEIKIEEIYDQFSSKGEQAVDIKIKNYNDYLSPNIKKPLLEFFCEGSSIYELDEALYDGYEKTLYIPFEWDWCNKIVVHLRDGNNAEIYAADSHSIPQT